MTTDKEKILNKTKGAQDKNEKNKPQLPDHYVSHLPGPRATHFIVPVAGLVLALVFLAGTEFAVERFTLIKIEESHQSSVVSNSISSATHFTLNLFSERLTDIRQGVVVVSNYINVGSGETLVETVEDLPGRNVNQLASLADWGENIGYFWLALRSNFSFYFNAILNNWRNFLSREGSGKDALGVVDEDRLREEIKQEILAELGAELERLLLDGVSEPTILSGQTDQGVVVMPDSGQNRDETIRRLKNIFSDRVLVEFDDTGQAGVITPVFRSGPGGNYIFVLTPVDTAR